MKNLCWLIIAPLTLCFLAACTSPGSESSTSATTSTTTSTSTTVTIKGQTLYSADGGTTTETANFEFDVPSSATKSVRALGSRDTSSTSAWIAVEGKIRAGDILISLTGTFNTSTKEFNLRASGYVLTIRIDITIKGLYTPSTDTISEGQTDIVVTDTTDGTTQTFSTTTVASGEDTTKPIDGATTTATEPSAAQTKFWEGTWATSQAYYYNSDGSSSSTATDIYLTYNGVVTCTATQFQERTYTVLTNVPTTWGWSANSWYQTGVLTKIISETSSTGVAIFSVERIYGSGSTEKGYSKFYIELTSSGKLSGAPYYASESSQWIFDTASDAEDLAVRLVSSDLLTLDKVD